MPYVRPQDLGLSFTEDGRILLRSPMRGIGARIPSFAVEVLSYCSTPRSAQEIEARYGGQARQLFEDLVKAEILVDAAGAASTPGFFANFAAIDVHRRMLADRLRVDAYAAALADVVKPGMAVLDAGTGSGVLATLAAHAGARVVYAVDNSDVLDLATETFARSGVGDRVRPIRADFRTVALPEKVDVIVTEIFGAWALAEDGLRDIVPCAERNLAPGGRILPDRVGLYLAPVSDRTLLDDALGPFGVQHGVNLGALRESALRRGLTRVVKAGALAAPGEVVSTVRLGEEPDPVGTVHFDLPESELTGFCAWFTLHFGDRVLSTAPDAPTTHWEQQYLPADPFLMAGAWDLTVELTPPPDDRRGLEARIVDGTRSFWYRLR